MEELAYDLWNPEEDNFDLDLEDEFFDFFDDLEGVPYGQEEEEFQTDEEDDLGFFQYEDHYWRYVDGKPLFLKVTDSSIAEFSVFSELECPERHDPWHYEATFFLLEELESLFLAWKRRTAHSFTAHLKPESSPPTTTTGSDTDEERPTKKSSQLTHAVLSKRKFCESTLIFYSIFPQYEPFIEVYREVQGIKKRILDIRFALFLNSIPSELTQQLPDELWLKIWRFSANPVDTLTLPFQPYFQEAMVDVEKNRLSELFLSVLRLHKILYKILFTFVLRNEPMQEMHPYSGAPQKVIESLFWCHWGDVKRNLSRLNDLDATLKKEPFEGDFKNKIKRGVFAYEMAGLHQQCLKDVEQVGFGDSFSDPEALSPIWNVSHVFFPNKTLNGTFLFLQKYLSQDSNVYIRFLVWNAYSNSLLSIIYTNILLVDYISCLEYGYNLISFSGDVIAFTLPSISPYELSITTFTWTLNTTEKELPSDPHPIKQSFIIDSKTFNYIPNTVSQGLAVVNGSNMTLTMISIDDDKPSTLHGYSSDNTFSESFPSQSIIKDVKGDKVLIVSRSSSGSLVQLFDLSERKCLHTYVTDRTTDKYRPSVMAMFDHHPDSQKYFIFIQSKRYYVLMDYSNPGEPMIGKEGYISSEMEECLDESLIFYNGLLFFIEVGNQLQDRSQYYIKFFDFESTRIVTPIYFKESSLVHPCVDNYFAETKRIFFIGIDKLAFCRNKESLIYLDFAADTASSVAKELEFLKKDE